MSEIVPSVGRKVWYYDDADQLEPYDATVVRVCITPGEAAVPSTPVNLYVVDPGGNTRLVPQVQCAQSGATGPHYRWMPYQLSQAAPAAKPEPDPEPAPIKL